MSDIEQHGGSRQSGSVQARVLPRSCFGAVPAVCWLGFPKSCWALRWLYCSPASWTRPATDSGQPWWYRDEPELSAVEMGFGAIVLPGRTLGCTKDDPRGHRRCRARTLAGSPGPHHGAFSQFTRHAPSFVTTSCGADLIALKFWPLVSVKRFAARKTTALTVVSSAMRQEFNAQGIQHSDLRVEPIGVDLQAGFIADESIERSKDEILFVRRLVEKKGLRWLIKAIPAILERHPSAFLTIAGFGPEKLALQRHAKKTGACQSCMLPGCRTVRTVARLVPPSHRIRSTLCRGAG